MNFSGCKVQAEMKGFYVSLVCFALLSLEYVILSSAQSSCGSIYLNAQSSMRKVLTSPNYPSNYPSSSLCKWYITAPVGYVVQLKFTDFDTYGSYGSAGSCLGSSHTLQIYDSNNEFNSKLLGKYCGKYIPANVVSTSKYLLLKFTSSFYSTRKGFRLEYTAIENRAEDYSVCSPFNSANTNKYIRLRTSGGTKYIKSPLYPNKYPSNIKCTWHITAFSSSKRIKLTISDVKIYNYNYSCSSYSSQDVLTIRDGSSSYSTLLKQMCSGNYSSTTVTSTGKYMWIQFKTNSDNYFTGSTAGFKIEYTEFDVSSSSDVGMIVGVLFAVAVVIVIACCVCIAKLKRTAGYVQTGRQPAATTTTSYQPPPGATPQYPIQMQGGPQPQGSYQPPPGGKYPPQPQGNYPPPPPPGGSYPPPGGSYPPPPPGGNYPQQPQGSYPPPPPGGNYPQQPQGSYPPPQSSYPPQSQGSYPPPTGGYPPPSDPPPQYPGPPAYPPQPNPPYPPRGSDNQQAAPPYPMLQDTKAGAPPQF